MIEQEEALTFSDEDFERRYSSEETSGAAGPPSPPPAAAPQPFAAQTGRSRNRFMRTLLRRRLAASGRT